VRLRREGFAGQRVVVLPQAVVAAALRHPLLKNLLPTSIGCFPKAKGHSCCRETGAEQAIFIYCAQGAGWCEIANHTHEVKRESLLVIPAHVPHWYGADRRHPWSIYWFHALGASVPAYLEALGASPAAPVVPLGGDVQLFSHFEETLQALDQGFALPQLLYAVHALGHLAGLMVWQRYQVHQEGVPGRERVVKSIEFMKEHLGEPLRVQTLAGLANLSASRYTAVFRQSTGYAPREYLVRLRMSRAIQLLSTTALPIKVISAQVGWPDSLYFSRLFHALHGHSPTEHRHRHESLCVESVASSHSHG
jgi:AraC family transcriptional regulator, arabinose operon regulatory protein